MFIELIYTLWFSALCFTAYEEPKWERPMRLLYDERIKLIWKVAEYSSNVAEMFVAQYFTRLCMYISLKMFYTQQPFLSYVWNQSVRFDRKGVMEMKKGNSHPHPDDAEENNLF